MRGFGTVLAVVAVLFGWGCPAVAPERGDGGTRQRRGGKTDAGGWYEPLPLSLYPVWQEEAERFVGPTSYCMDSNAPGWGEGPVSLLWRRAVPYEPMAFEEAPPSIFGERYGVLYVKAASWLFYLDAEDGVPIYMTRAYVPVLEGARGVLGPGDRLSFTFDGVFALGTRTGEPVGVLYSDAFQGYVTTPPVVTARRTVLVGTTGGVALELGRDLNISEDYPFDGEVWRVASGPNHSVILHGTKQRSDGGWITSLARVNETGIVWRNDMESMTGFVVTRSGVIVANTTPFRQATKLRAYSAELGTHLWTWPDDADPPIPLAKGAHVTADDLRLGLDDEVYFLLAEPIPRGEVNEVSLWHLKADLQPRWVFRPGAIAERYGLSAHPVPILADESADPSLTYVYPAFGCTLFALDRETGKIVWTYRTPHPIRDVKAGEDGRVYIHLRMNPSAMSCEIGLCDREGKALFAFDFFYALRTLPRAREGKP